MTIEKCEALGIPRRLWWEKKPIIQEFDGNELLFRWFAPHIQFEEGRISASSLGEVFSPPVDISCNRSKLCEYKTDVLYNTNQLPHREQYGVFQANVKDVKNYEFSFSLEKGLEGTNKSQFQIKLDVIHAPEECMYPHSAIVVYVNEEEIKPTTKLKPPSLRSAIREHVAPLFEICHLPDANFRLDSLL